MQDPHAHASPKAWARLQGHLQVQGLGGMVPGTPAPFVVLADLLFESVEAFQSAFAQHATEIMSDISNYASLQSMIQISQVKM